MTEIASHSGNFLLVIPRQAAAALETRHRLSLTKAEELSPERRSTHERSTS